MEVGRALANRRFRLVLVAVLAILGWGALVILAALGLARTPPQAGFDLFLVLDAGRRLAMGESPYTLSGFGGGTQAESLFYSYPPPVAQAASLVADVPPTAVYWVVVVAGVVSLALVAARLAARMPTGRTASVAVPSAVLAVYAFPFAVALLFGNVDLFYPAVFGLLVAALALEGGRGRSAAYLAGFALALLAIAKLQPAALLVWMGVRWLRDREGRDRAGQSRGRERLAAAGAAAVVTGVLVVSASLAVGGIGPWQDYVALLRAGSATDLVSPLNIGPASQLALLAGDEALATTLAPFLAVAALFFIAASAWIVADTAMSLAIAVTAMLVVTPITWFHYPVALVPFAILALARADAGDRRRVVAAILGAIVVAAVSVALPVVVWIAVALALVAVGRSSPVLPSGAAASASL